MENSKNLIDDGNFEKVSFGGHRYHALNTDRARAGDWTLYFGPTGHHKVKFVPQGNSEVPGNLPSDLVHGNFACLNYGDSALIGTPLNRTIKKGEKLIVTWWQAPTAEGHCHGRSGSYDVTVQLRYQVVHEGAVESEWLMESHPVYIGSGWQHARTSVWEAQREYSQVYLSFKGDKRGNACGAVISGIKVLSVGGAQTDKITFTSSEGDTIYAETDAPVKKGITLTFLSGETPLAGANVSLTIEDPNHTKGHFVGSDAVVIYATDDNGRIVVAPNTVIAGGEGTIYIYATVNGQKLMVATIIVKKGSVQPSGHPAFSVVKLASARAGGDEQQTRSGTVFARPLVVSVRAKEAGQLADSGKVTFLVSHNGGTTGYLTTNASDSWNNVSMREGTGSVDATVEAGTASIWLWGQHDSSAPYGDFSVAAMVKEHPTSKLVTFKERVWLKSTDFILAPISEQQPDVVSGRSPDPLTAKLTAGKLSPQPVAKEWLHWTIDPADSLTFIKPNDSNTFEWENERSVWTLTGADGKATTPGLKVVGNPVVDERARVTVATPLAAQALTFTLNLHPAKEVTKYTIHWRGAKKLRVGHEQMFAVTVLDSEGKGVGDVEVHAESLNRELTVSPAFSRTAVSPDADVGKALFGLRATPSGNYQLKLSTKYAESITIPIFAGDQVQDVHLHLEKGSNLSIGLDEKLEGDPVVLRLQPTDSSLTKLDFLIKPLGTKSHLLARIDESDNWSLQGQLQRGTDGEFRIKALHLATHELDPGDPTSYDIEFKFRDREDIASVVVRVTVGEGIYVVMHPDRVGDSLEHAIPLEYNTQTSAEDAMYVAVFKDKNHDTPADGVSLVFTIVNTANTSFPAKFAKSGSTVEHGVSVRGKCYLPPLKVPAGQVTFTVTVHEGHGSAPIGIWYFRASPPLVAKRIEFAMRVHSVAAQQVHQSIDQVTVYSDETGRHTVFGGVVTFSIAAGSARGATFARPDGVFPTPTEKAVLNATARINTKGVAKVPAIWLPHTGKLILHASVGTNANAQPATYDIDSD